MRLAGDGRDRDRCDEDRVAQVRLGHEAAGCDERHDRPAVTCGRGPRCDEDAEVRQQEVLVLPRCDQHLGSHHPGHHRGRDHGRQHGAVASEATDEPGGRDDRGDVNGGDPDGRARHRRDSGEGCEEIQLERAEVVDVAFDVGGTGRPGSDQRVVFRGDVERSDGEVGVVALRHPRAGRRTNCGHDHRKRREPGCQERHGATEQLVGLIVCWVRHRGSCAPFDSLGEGYDVRAAAEWTSQEIRGSACCGSLPWRRCRASRNGPSWWAARSPVDRVGRSGVG